MRASLLLSFVLHALLLAAALVSFGAHQPLKETQPISVAVAPPSAVTMLKAGKPNEASEETASRPPPAEKQPANVVPTAVEIRPPAETVAQKQAALLPPKPKTAAPADSEAKADKQTPPPKPEAPAANAAKPAATPPAPKRVEAPKPRQEAAAKSEAKPKPEKHPEPKPQARPQRDRIAELAERPAPDAEGKAEFDPQQIAALLNRDPTAGQRPSQDGPREPWRKPSSLQEQALGTAPEPLPDRESHGDPAGRDGRMSANDIDAFRAQIARCWTPPVGGLGGDAIIVKLRIELNQDGTLSRPPQLANSFDSPFFRPAADSAMRAIFQCQPYRMPPEKYGQWRDMLLNFDPSRMFGG
ncbi:MULTISPECIES: hypothetical protein [Rhodomicrobium]|uniref:hypothetical protein n=1 Tax=Rhodomicrobium TaxID=1068 RepID=UPI000B4B0695|nr:MULTISPECIES: hypothetical protein [Rhodomicrobium]